MAAVAALLLLAADARRPAAARGAAVVRVPVLRHVYPNLLPAGGAGEIAGRACALCHSPSLITQQRKDSLGWEKTLALMEKWGAPVGPGEHDSLRVYLLAHFGPVKR